MTGGVQAHLAAAQEWARQALQAGWLDADDAAALERFDATEPGALFDGEARPLVAAFFGGTGVGKSSLLNRLAGEAVARVGVERPTSHEVSLYLHETVELARLPGEFPVERVRVARHRNAARRALLWIDMPDMDSTDAANRTQALAWLPHIDVVIYVVSPERYRDDRGWRLLVQHGRRHAWLFVMNQSDRADPLQVDDLLRQLQRAGFAQPVVLRTDCRPEADRRQADDFPRLEALLGELVERHALERMQRHADRQPRTALQERLADCAERLAGVAALDALKARWAESWRDASAAIRDGQAWAIRSHSAALAGGGPNAAPAALWDEWAQSAWDDALGRLAVEAGEHGWPIRRVRDALAERSARARSVVLAETRLATVQALARPGGRGRRFLSRLSSLALAILPLAATGWVAVRAVDAWRLAGETASIPYLGSDFVIHGALLIGLSALLPWLLLRALKPDLQRLAEQALRRGLDNALVRLEQEAVASLTALEEERRSTVQALAELQAVVGEQYETGEAPADPTLERMWQIPAADVALVPKLELGNQRTSDQRKRPAR